MIPRCVPVLLVLFLLGSAGGAGAVIGTLDDVPAATLLLPYFEVDPFDPNGTRTIFTIRNASAAPVVAKVTFWSNLSNPVLDFDVYLTGFDQQTFDLRPSLWPQTALIATIGRSHPSRSKSDFLHGAFPRQHEGGRAAGPKRTARFGSARRSSSPASRRSFRPGGSTYRGPPRPRPSPKSSTSTRSA